MALVWLWADTPSYTLTCTLYRTPRRHRDSPPRVGPRIRGRSRIRIGNPNRIVPMAVTHLIGTRITRTRHTSSTCMLHRTCIAPWPGVNRASRQTAQSHAAHQTRSHAGPGGPHRSMVAQSFGPSLVGSLGVVLARKALEHGLHSGYCCPQRCGDARQAVAECRKGERGGLSCGQRRRAEPVARGGGGKTSN